MVGRIEKARTRLLSFSRMLFALMCIIQRRWLGCRKFSQPFLRTDGHPISPRCWLELTTPRPGQLYFSSEPRSCSLCEGRSLADVKEIKSAIAEFQTAIALDRNFATAHAALGRVLIFAGRSAKSFPHIETAIRLSPRDPLLANWYYIAGHAHIHQGRYDEAIEWCRRSIAGGWHWFACIDLISVYGWKDQKEEAAAVIAELHKLKPGYSVQDWADERWSDNPIFLEEYQQIVEGLRKAGLQEKY